jgi:tetratricopeptide (TPR) repeat protein
MAQAETFLQQAVDRFSQNAAAAPMVADALLDLGSVAVKLKNYSHAIELYDRVQKVSPKSSAAATARFNAGVAFLKMAPPEYARAVESFEAYLAASPDGPLVDKAWLNEAQAFEMQGVASKDPAALARAQSAYRQVVARTKDNDLAARSLWKIGGIQAQLKQPQEAVATLETAIHKYPNARDIESIVFDKGRILQEARLYDDALVTYRSYLDKFPNSVNAPAVHFNMAVIEYNTGGTQLSKAQDERIAAKSAVLKQAAHDSYVQAASDFEQALTAPSSMAPLRMETREQALYLQGWAYLNSDAPPRALSVFRSLLRDFPNGEHAATAAGRIGILEVSSNPDEAELMLRKCLDSHPKETEAVEPWLAMGQLYQVKGEYDKALPLLAKVIESSAATYDDAAAATYCQGRCYQGQGVKTKARDSYLSVTVDFKDSTEWVDRAKAALKELGPV